MINKDVRKSLARKTEMIFLSGAGTNILLFGKCIVLVTLRLLCMTPPLVFLGMGAP